METHRILQPNFITSNPTRHWSQVGLSSILWKREMYFWQKKPSFGDLFYEPFYQIFRKQLLAWEKERGKELRAEKMSFLHTELGNKPDFKVATSPVWATMTNRKKSGRIYLRTRTDFWVSRSNYCLYLLGMNQWNIGINTSWTVTYEISNTCQSGQKGSDDLSKVKPQMITFYYESISTRLLAENG